MRLTRTEFERLVEEGVRMIPRRFRKHMRNISVVVEDRPSRELLRELGLGPRDTLFGLYQGTPLPDRSWDFGNVLPDRITIYQDPIERACETADEMVRVVAETVLHEFGHYFGLSEDELEAIERQFWSANDA